MRHAELECGHTVTVPNYVEAGCVTACPDCEPPEGAPGCNRKVISLLGRKMEIGDRTVQEQGQLGVGFFAGGDQVWFMDNIGAESLMRFLADYLGYHVVDPHDE